MPDATYLLDTGILLGYVRDVDYARHVDEEYAPAEPPNLAFVSVVSRGEIFSLAYQFGWGKRKRRSLQKLLADLPTLQINDDEIIARYAEVDAFSQGKLSDRPLPGSLSARNMGKI